MFVNHLCEAKGEQDGEANKAQECFAEFVIPSSNSPVAFDFLEEVFYPMTTAQSFAEHACGVCFCAPRNAGFNSVGARRLPEGGAIIGFVADREELLEQAVRQLCRQGNVGLVPTGQGLPAGLRARIDNGMDLRV